MTHPAEPLSAWLEAGDTLLEDQPGSVAALNGQEVAITHSQYEDLLANKELLSRIPGCWWTRPREPPSPNPWASGRGFPFRSGATAAGTYIPEAVKVCFLDHQLPPLPEDGGTASTPDDVQTISTPPGGPELTVDSTIFELWMGL